MLVLAGQVVVPGQRGMADDSKSLHYTARRPDAADELYSRSFNTFRVELHRGVKVHAII